MFNLLILDLLWGGTSQSFCILSYYKINYFLMFWMFLSKTIGAPVGFTSQIFGVKHLLECPLFMALGNSFYLTAH